MSPPLMSPANTSDASLTQVEFHSIAMEWTNGIGSTSNPVEMIDHPAYRRMVRMGQSAVPFLLRELKGEPSLLFLALREITGENPVPSSARGRMSEIAKAWVAWGQRKALL